MKEYLLAIALVVASCTSSVDEARKTYYSEKERIEHLALGSQFTKKDFPNFIYADHRDHISVSTLPVELGQDRSQYIIRIVNTQAQTIEEYYITTERDTIVSITQ